LKNIMEGKEQRVREVEGAIIWRSGRSEIARPVGGWDWGREFICRESGG
jgi:hypothetical protein